MENNQQAWNRQGRVKVYSRLSIYNIFISHSWRYADDYETIIGWLRDAGIVFNNYSVSSEKSFDRMSEANLKRRITEQINHASIVIIMGGMYVSHSSWITYEINEALRLGKPIIAVKPRGNERMPMPITSNDIMVVNWNCNSLVTAVKEML